MTAWRVRPFADADYTAYARIARLHRSGTGDPAAARADDAMRDPRYDHVRLVAVDEEDAPIGYGSIYHEPTRYDSRRYVLDLGVDTTKRRRGVGAALWDGLRLELAARSAEVVGLWTGDATACNAFIVKRGFVEVARANQQVRAVASAPLPTRAVEERVTGTGIRITTLAALRNALGDRGLEAVWELHTAIRSEDVTLGRAMPDPFVDWLAQSVTGEAALPDAHFVALDGGRYVGASAARRDGDDTLRMAITGVLPPYRRRGIGRLLKLRVHAWARANGFSEIHTTVTKDNAAMLALNDGLGYPIVSSWGGYELRI